MLSCATASPRPVAVGTAEIRVGSSVGRQGGLYFLPNGKFQRVRLARVQHIGAVAVERRALDADEP